MMGWGTPVTVLRGRPTWRLIGRVYLMVRLNDVGVASHVTDIVVVREVTC